MDNQTIIQYFECDLPPDGLLWQRAAAQAKALKEIGFDIVWLPPAYKGTEGANDVGYGVYDLYDLGEFDQKGTVPTKYGTKEEYLAGVKALQKEGIAVLADIVLDHRMGADETEEVNAEQFDQADRNKQIAGETTISAWTKFTFPGRAGKYSDFIWDWKCFSAGDWDEKSKQSGFFRVSGKDWPQDVEKENGNFDYLIGADVDVRNPEVGQ